MSIICANIVNYLYFMGFHHQFREAKDRLRYIFWKIAYAFFCKNHNAVAAYIVGIILIICADTVKHIMFLKISPDTSFSEKEA